MVILIGILSLFLGICVTSAQPLHEDRSNLAWKEEIKVFCLGHGADHSAGYVRVTELMKDSQLHIDELDHLIDEIADDRPLSRMSYFIHHAALGIAAKDHLLRKCLNKSTNNNWHETQYFFASETNILTFDELSAAKNSSNESLASAAKRALDEKRYSSRSHASAVGKKHETAETISGDKEHYILRPSSLYVMILIVLIFGFLFSIFFRKKPQKKPISRNSSMFAPSGLTVIARGATMHPGNAFPQKSSPAPRWAQGVFFAGE
jgi:hypothetical protein